MPGPEGRPISLLVINQYYEPDIAASGALLTETCEGLAADGFDVRVVTAQPSYTESSSQAPERETRNGVEVHRVSLGGARGRVSMRTRLRGYFKFLYSAKRKAAALARERPADIIVTMSNPPLIERAGRSLSKSVGAKWVHIIHDIHPDVLLAGGQIKLPPLTAGLWRTLSGRALRRADRIVVLSGNMKKSLVESRGVDADRVEVISLWAIPEVTELPAAGDTRARFGIPEDHLLIIHTGNMGIIHGLEQAVDAAAELRDAPVTFLFVGDGATKSALETRAAGLKLENVKFLPFQSREDYLRIVSASDACLVSLRAGMERYSLPSKAFTILAAGKPIVGLLQPGNDISEILAESEVGWSASSASELAVQLRRLCERRDEVAEAGVSARALYESRFTRAKAIERYRSMFQDMVRP